MSGYKFLILPAALLLMSGSIRADTSTVEISGFQFKPQELTVARGSTVVWINRDQTIHNIATAGAKFASAGLDTGDRFNFRFDAEGDYPYFCALHPQMVGVIHVRAQ